MKTRNFYAAGVLALFMLVSACTKEGPAGPAGKDGNDGNANVVSSNTVALTSWTVLLDDGTNYNYNSTCSWSVLTQDVISNGVVMAYFQWGSTEWWALPYSATSSNGSVSLNYSLNVGSITFEATGTPSPGTSAFSNILVRVVAIPASQLSQHKNVDLQNYEAVKAEYGLKD